ncbi:MAG TPA: hypothetical protein VH592_03240 [Gemmataceae bacterium]
MEQLCVIRTARWSVRVTKADPKRNPGTGIRLDVEYQCDGKFYEQVSYFSEEIDEYGPPPKNLADPRFAPMFANHLGFSVSRVDLDNLRFLATATESLCLHVLYGEAIKLWCSLWGTRPQSHRGEVTGQMTPGRKRPLVINLPDGAFIVERETFLSCASGE